MLIYNISNYLEIKITFFTVGSAVECVLETKILFIFVNITFFVQFSKLLLYFVRVRCASASIARVLINVGLLHFLIKTRSVRISRENNLTAV